MLQSDDLRKYLTESHRHYALLPDYVSMEAYRGETLTGIYHSMMVLSEFPEQVIVLKGTRKACGLTGSPRAMRRALIDRDQSAAFADFCGRLYLARRGDERWQRALLKRARLASEDLSVIDQSVSSIVGARADVARTYAQSDLRALRTGKRMSQTFKDAFMKNVILLATSLLEDHPEVKRIPQFENLPGRYLFRLAVCAQLWIVDWILEGSQTTIRPDKTGNDLIDLQVAVCATYFDGLMSKDKKLQRIYSYAKAILSGA